MPPSHLITAPVMKGFSIRNSPFIVKRTAAIVTVPDYIAAVWRDSLGLAVSPLPFEVPGYEVSMLWTAANDQDPGLRWLAESMAQTLA